MGFSDELSSLPMALEVECLVPGPDGAIVWQEIRDSMPFGKENITIEEVYLDLVTEKNKSKEVNKNQNTEKLSKETDNYIKKQQALEACLGKADLGLSAGPYLDPIEWRVLEPGLWRAETTARYGPRLGPREIVLVRASPERFRLAPYHESENDSWKNFPGNIRAWAKRLPEAPVLVNGGMYYPNRSYMGALRRQGKDIGSPTHATFKGFLVQDPLPGEPVVPRGPLVDLETQPDIDPKGLGKGKGGFDTVIQSYMVLDRLGRVRVKATERLASRAVLGFDHDGWAVVVMVKGAITMSDLAILCQKLGLVSALGLDGGLETQLAFNGPNRIETKLGSYGNNYLGNFRAHDLSPSIPSVIAFERLVEVDSQPGPGGLHGPESASPLGNGF
jgi:hypothetical protein